MSPTKAAKSTTATNKKRALLTDEERAAMKELVKERKAVASSRIARRRKVPFKIDLAGLPLERTLTDEHEALRHPRSPLSPGVSGDRAALLIQHVARAQRTSEVGADVDPQEVGRGGPGVVDYQDTYAHRRGIVFGGDVADRIKPPDADRQNERLTIIEHVVTLDGRERTATRAERTEPKSSDKPDDDAKAKAQGEYACHQPKVGPRPRIGGQIGSTWRLAIARGPRRGREGSEMSSVSAEGVGFEPTEALRLQRFSRPPPSTARPPLRSNNDRPLVSS